jgi:3-hydroxyacyl-[acyl-carrier-protein] dehydratase
MNSLNIQEILSMIPHRYPFIMIDRVIDYDTHNLTAIKNVSINEPYIQGHFPGNHIMPGVMMIESMAQASTVLAFKHIEDNSDIMKYFKGAGVLFSGADQIKFKKVVLPGDQLYVYTTLVRNARNLFEFESRIEVQGIIVAEAKLKAIAGV